MPDRLARLVRLEIELGLAEAREVVIAALVAGVTLVAALAVLLAGALAPLFAVPWEPLVTGGGVVAVLALAALAWSALRVERLTWPQMLASIEETWRWLAAQTRSRLTSR